jgi:hypothetical protein
MRSPRDEGGAATIQSLDIPIVTLHGIRLRRSPILERSCNASTLILHHPSHQRCLRWRKFYPPFRDVRAVSANNKRGRACTDLQYSDPETAGSARQLQHCAKPERVGDPVRSGNKGTNFRSTPLGTDPPLGKRPKECLSDSRAGWPGIISAIGRGIIDLRGTHLVASSSQSAKKAQVNLRRATSKYFLVAGEFSVINDYRPASASSCLVEEIRNAE